MTAAPGWYEAGAPGKLRWWDGTQWTAYEADTPAGVPSIVAPAGQAAPSAALPQHGGRNVGPRPGWYPTPTGRLRWWDGSRWTGMRVKRGKPGIDWSTMEQPTLAWVFGGLFLLLSLLQFGLGTVAGDVSISGLLTLALALVWLAMAWQTTTVRRIPRPQGEPSIVDAVRPLPDEQEGAGAGWYPVATRVTRWWTGSRWAHYTGTQYGVRPTFHGPRAFRMYLVMCWVLIGMGVLALLAGVLLLVNSADDSYALIGVVFSGFIAVGGVFLVTVGGVLLSRSREQRRVLLLPERPPH